MKSWIFLLLVFLLLFVGCLSGPLPEELPKTIAPTTPPPPSVESLNFIPFETLSLPAQDPEFAALTPEIEGLFLLPFFNPVDVVANDLGVLNHPNRLQLLASIISKRHMIYVRPQKETDMVIYYTVYKMNDSSIAASVLEAYKSVWNKRPLNLSGGQIWIWDGFFDEMEGRAAPLGKNSILYWNPESDTAFFTDRVLEDHPTLTMPTSALYSVHGETVYGQYFIMIDVKTQLQDIQNTTTSIFTQAAEDIFRNASLINQTPIPTTAPVPVNASATSEVERVRENLRNLLESFLSGNITKEEYDAQFEQYEAFFLHQIFLTERMH
jgi:hypothetical protein